MIGTIKYNTKQNGLMILLVNRINSTKKKHPQNNHIKSLSYKHNLIKKI